jgi:AcrR family transcriptional regulator
LGDSELGLRERKKQRLKAHLEEVAGALFDDKGFDNTTVEDIAAAAQVSRRTLFRYFPTKEDLVFGDGPGDLAFLQRCLHDRPDDELADTAVRNACLAFADHLDRKRAETLKRARFVGETPSLLGRSLRQQDEWLDVIAEELAGRPGVSEKEVRVFAIMGKARLTEAARLWGTNGNGQATFADVVDQVFSDVDDVMHASWDSHHPDPG